MRSNGRGKLCGIASSFLNFREWGILHSELGLAGSDGRWVTHALLGLNSMAGSDGRWATHDLLDLKSMAGSDGRSAAHDLLDLKGNLGGESGLEFFDKTG